jgi:septal ring factor EnvC (AmiA/AmiB activator)
MADYATKNEVQEIVNKAVDDLSEIIQSFAHNVDVRFNKVEADIAELNAKYDHLITTLDTFLKRLDDIETDNHARDAQLARLERWIEQIATKTGVKLEY